MQLQIIKQYKKIYFRLSNNRWSLRSHFDTVKTEYSMKESKYFWFDTKSSFLLLFVIFCRIKFCKILMSEDLMKSFFQGLSSLIFPRFLISLAMIIQQCELLHLSLTLHALHELTSTTSVSSSQRIATKEHSLQDRPKINGALPF